MYYLFLDESGDHNYINLDNVPIFVLVGCIFNNKSSYLNYLDAVTNLHKIKEEYFNNFYTIFHTRDITRCAKDFKIVQNVRFREKFYNACNETIRDTNFCVICAIINKVELYNKYSKKAVNPYDYCFDRIIERFVYFLDDAQDEKKGVIFYESRRNDLDKELEHRYKDIIRNGTKTIPGEINLPNSRINRRITKLIKLKKDSNIAGIQFSDLCATPISRNELCLKDNFVKYEIVKNKFRKSVNGEIDGFGVVRCK